MVGKNNGVAAMLKRENPRLINVHCICHRLALACGDSNNELDYMLTIERLLLQLYKWLENSCVKTAAFLKMQLKLQDMQLPADESKRHKIGHKLQRACRTRWLSTDKALMDIAILGGTEKVWRRTGQYKKGECKTPKDDRGGMSVESCGFANIF